MHKIVVLDGFAANPGDLPWAPLAELGDLTVYDRTSPDQVVERIGDAACILSNKVVISRAVMDACPSIRYVGILATGYNVIDLEAAAEKGLVVTNIPNYSTDAVAQHVFALLLEACNHVGHHSAAVHAGRWGQGPDWCFWDMPLVELTGKTMGLIGFGSIGRRTAHIARAFGMRVLVYARTPRSELDDQVEFVSLNDLCRQSDIVSLHVPLSAETENLINRDTLARMKPGVIVINTARGRVVHAADMTAALRSGQVGCFAADVADREPIADDSPLLGLPNCILTPHVAWASQAARGRLLDIAANNLKQFQAGAPVNVVGG